MQSRIRTNAGFLANLTFSIFSVIGIFITTPLIIRNYDQDIYLLWSIVNSICGLLFILDFGITSVASREFLKSAGNPSEFSWSRWTRFRIFHNKILAIGTLFLLIIFYFQWQHKNLVGFSIENIFVFFFILVGTVATILSHQQIIKFQII